jgi:asparagine synthetase B (glutamine-hydrolysing)
MLRGMFSFVLYDRTTGFYGAGRDHMGITPLYIGYGLDGSIWFASELKALVRLLAGKTSMMRPAESLRVTEHGRSS